MAQVMDFRINKKSKATVFAVHKSESASGYHEVSWAKDGNLNASHRRGHIRRFRLWPKAKAFAKQKGKELNAEVVID